ncbi:hypothetical protein TNCV_2493221 [Trichonephila clavipes]|uniref:Uncharacterized protein n=1 Tax=Trichonephila clavipes TaxID=2585209 RepID=A0A8X6RXC5_TRICX|nr:hypothetical protein TNCV_2493221 [Trichonephila clavipes]
MQPKAAFMNISSKLDAGRSRKSSGIDYVVEVFPVLALRNFVGVATSVSAISLIQSPQATGPQHTGGKIVDILRDPKKEGRKPSPGSTTSGFISRALLNQMIFQSSGVHMDVLRLLEALGSYTKLGLEPPAYDP